MLKLTTAAIAAALALAAAMPAHAQGAYEKKNYNYAEWAKGRFSEAVTVVNPGKFIFLAGVGAEDENGKGGDIRLARVSDKIDNVMKLLGFSKVIKVFGGLDEAVSSYKPTKD